MQTKDSVNAQYSNETKKDRGKYLYLSNMWMNIIFKLIFMIQNSFCLLLGDGLL